MIPLSKTVCVIPLSSVWFGAHLREKTLRVASILRTCGIFRIPTLYLLDDIGERATRDEVKEIADYLLLPPYLKKHIKLSDTLRYVGIAPPIKTPLHQVKFDSEPALGEVRAGIVVSADSNRTLVDVGLRDYCELTGADQIRAGTRVIVQVISPKSHSNHRPRAKIITTPRGMYLGTELRMVPTNDLSWVDPNWYKVELTRHGSGHWSELPRNENRWIAIFVGNQRDDPSAICSVSFDKRVCLMHYQGVETIRSEEAIFIALSQLSGLN
jgi:predicted SPOUT superfamily RNA methylase MTH1